MKILIADIPEEGLEIDLDEKVSLDGHPGPAAVKAQLSVSKAETEVIISGNLRAGLDLQCSRCLKDLRLDLDIPVTVVYHPIDEVTSDRHELKDDEMDLSFYRDEIDLQELFREQILLNERMKPLCDENCKGICPVCGTDLNVAACNCSTKTMDPRLAVLKKLLEPGKE